MSVLKRKRKLSTMEFVTNAQDIEKQSLDFVKRLSPKNARIYQDQVVRLASLQFNLVYVANEIFPTNTAEYQVRRLLMGVSKAVLHVLDTKMASVYECLMENPQEAFNRKNGKPIPKAEAIAILDRMAEELGCNIDKQDALLKGVRDSDKERAKTLPAADGQISATLAKAAENATLSFANLFP